VHEAGRPADARATAARWRLDPAYLVVGLALLSNGAALVLHIVRGIPLPPQPTSGAAFGSSGAATKA
jgi:hypothetical protein